MKSISSQAEIWLNSGDPEIRTWFLVRHNYLPFILCGSYVLFSTILGPALMKNKKPYNLRRTMVFFNLFVVAIYGTSVLGGTIMVRHITFEQFCYGVNVKKGDATYIVFFILRKKNNLVSFLHVSHHTIVPIFAWIIMRSNNGGLMAIPTVVNAIVHIIMYSYYGLAAMGPKVRKYLWWKQYLTQLQMAQMVLISVFITILAPLTGCKVVISTYILTSVIYPFYFYLFYRFYISTFKHKSKALDQSKSHEKDKKIETNKDSVCQEQNGKISMKQK